MPDLTDIPGIPELWTRTLGDSRIKIAILDGPADLERACFVGANYTQIKPYWTQDIELNDEYFYYLKLATEFNQQQKAKKEESDHDKDEAKKEREAFFEQFPQDIRFRALHQSKYESCDRFKKSGRTAPAAPLSHSSDNVLLSELSI